MVVIDNKNLNEHEIRCLCAKSKRFVIVTTNKNHPAFNLKEENLSIIYQDELSLQDALIELNKI